MKTKQPVTEKPKNPTFFNPSYTTTASDIYRVPARPKAIPPRVNGRRVDPY